MRRRRVRSLLISAVVVLGVSSQGCGPTYKYPPQPPPGARLIPTIAGVVDHTEITATGWLYTLTDGRTVYEPDGSSDVQRLGGGNGSNDLVLASTTAPKFVAFLSHIKSGEPGCWEAWENQTDAPIAWDMGNSILFVDGLELAKAPDYDNSARQSVVDGRTAWTHTEADYGYHVCANSSGQIEWVKPGP